MRGRDIWNAQRHVELSECLLVLAYAAVQDDHNASAGIQQAKMFPMREDSISVAGNGKDRREQKD